MVMPSQAVTRYDLSQPFSEFSLEMNQAGYIGPSALRPRLVGVQAADVGKVPLEQLLQQHATGRAPGSGYKRGEWEFDKFAYATDEFGWEEALDDRTLAIFADMIDAEEVSTSRAIGFVCDEYERDCAAALYDTATWTGAALTTALTNEWDDATNATPIVDVKSAKEKVRTGSGLEANALICNRTQFENLLLTDEIVERIKYTRTPTRQELSSILAAVLGIDRVLVAGGLTNSANPAASANIASIWSDEYAMVAKVALSEDPKEPCVGRTFIWSEDGASDVGTSEKLSVVVEEYREETVRGGVLRARNERDIVVMYPEAAHLLSNVTT